MQASGVGHAAIAEVLSSCDPSPCDWCGKPASFKCSRCEFVHLCSKECQKKLQKTHKYICGRVTPVLTNPNVSPFYGVGDPAWDAAHRGLRGEYYRDAADGKVKMQSHYAPGEDRPDLFLVLPAPERQRVVEYLDVQSLCRMEQVMQNVYSLLAWYEALRGAWIPSVSAWPRYTSAGKFAGLRWSMNRRVELRGVKIWKVFVAISSCDPSSPHEVPIVIVIICIIDWRKIIQHIDDRALLPRGRQVAILVLARWGGDLVHVTWITVGLWGRAGKNSRTIRFLERFCMKTE